MEYTATSPLIKFISKLPAHSLGYTAGFISLVVYILCMPTVVTLEDSGLFNMVCHKAGIGHPPGYPFYSLLCFPFAHLPWINTPTGLNLLSALAASVAVIINYFIIQQLLHSYTLICKSVITLFSFVGALALVFSSSFWSQAIIQEMYSLNLMLSLASLLAMIRFYHCLCFKAWLLTIVSIVLGVCTHWPLTFLFGPTLLIIFIAMWIRRSTDMMNLFKPKQILISFAVFILALSPYLYLWLRSLYHVDVNFYGPLDYWQRFWVYISRSGYAGVDSSGSSLHQISFLYWLIEQARLQLTDIGIVLAGIGLLWSLIRLKLALSLALIWAFLAPTLVLTLLLNFSFEPTFTAVYQVYPLMSWAIMTLWVAFGFVTLYQLITYLIDSSNTITLGFAVISIGFIIYVAVLHFPQYNRTNDRWADKAARIYLQQFEPNADVFVFDDSHLPMMYIHLVEGVRPDIRIYNTQSLILGNRLFDIDTPLKYRPTLFANHIIQSKRPTYYFNPNLNLPFGAEDYGYFKKVRLDLPAGTVLWKGSPELDKQFTELYQQYGSQQYNHYWNHFAMENTLFNDLFRQAKTQKIDDIDHAKTVVGDVLNNNPTSYQANHLLAVIYLIEKKWEKAIEPLTLSLFNQPRVIDPLSNLANTLILLNRRNEAIELLETHQKKWPNTTIVKMIEEAKAGKYVNQSTSG